MSHSLRPKSERSSLAPDLPDPLAAALDRVRQTPTDLEAWEDLNEACREHDRPDEAAALYTETLENSMDPEALEDIGRLAADFCEEWYEDPGPTMEMLSAVLALDSSQSWAFERLTVLLTVAANWDALLKAYDTALAATEDDERKQLLLEEAAKVARDFAGKPQRGSDYLKDLLFLRLDDEQLASTLERRFDEQERHEDLIEIWTARISVLAKDAELKTRLQIAARHLDYLGDADSAYLSVEEFLEADGDETQACEVLERVANKDQASTDVRRQALRLLDKLHTAAGRFPEVISAVERSLTLAEDDDTRVALHRRAADLLAQVGQPEPALHHAAQILQLDPTLEEVRSNARALAEGIGRLDSYADAIVSAADGASQGSRRVELLIEAARVRRAELGDAQTATDLFFRIERDEASDEAARLLACQELSDLLEAAQRWDDLLVILERRADLEPKAAERARILGEAARLATRLGQGERALGLWSLRLNDDEKDLEALSAKVDLFASLDKNQGLVEALLARANVRPDAEGQREDMVRAAEVQAERLADLESSIKTWRLVEERFGRVAESLDSLVALSARADKHEQVVELLREGIEKETDPERAVRQLGLLGDTQRLHLQENSDALKSYRHALERDPTSEVAINGVRALLIDRDLAHFAGEALASAFRRSGAPQEVVGLLEVRLSAAPDDPFRAKVLLEAAMLEEQAGNLPQALAALSRAFALAPTETTEGQLHRLAEKTGDFASVAAAYGEAIARISEEDEVSGRLFLAKGRVEENNLLNPEAATDSYRAAVERAPAERECVHSLIRAGHTARLFSDAAWAITESSRARQAVSEEDLLFFAECAADHGQWEGALEGLADRIAASDGLAPEVAHDLKKQLAIWYRDRLGDPDSAEMVLRRAVLDFPQEDSLRILAELQRRTPGRPLVVTLTALADVCEDELAVLREAGDVALDPVGDPELARPLLERALELASKKFEEAGDPESEVGFEASDVVAWATDHLVTLCLRDADAKQAVRLLEASAALPFVHGEQVARQFRAAEVAAEGGLDDRAVKLCELVLDKESQHEGAITLLSALHEKAGRLDELLSLRKRELSLERPLGRRLFLRLDMARVLGQTGEGPEERIVVLQENLLDLPGHADSIEALTTILTAEESFAALADMLESQARAIVDGDPDRAAALWERAGRIAEDFLDDEARLAADFRLSASASASISVLDRLAVIANAEEMWDSEVSWLQQRVHLTPEIADAPEAIEDRRQVVVRLGTALMRSDDNASARAFLEEELAKDRPANEARQLLAQIYREMEEWPALSVLLTGGVEYAPDDATKIEYLRSAAQVERRRLNNLEAAIPLLEQAIELDAEDRGLKLMLADTLRTAESYDHAADILTGLLEEFGRRRTKERAVVHMQLARIAQAQGNLDEALQQAEAAAKIERTDAQILMLVGQLAREKGQLEKAEQAYRTLALIASRKTPSKAEDEGETVGESAILFELYRISVERGDEKQSRELLDSALEVATRDADEALRLADSLRASGQEELLLNALQQSLDSGAEGEMAARLLVTKANVLERSDRLEESLAARLQALESTPKDGKLIDSTHKIAERCGATERFWSHVVQLAEANRNQPAIAGELWYRAGRAAESESQDIERAAELYELSQKTGHKPKRTFLALDRILNEGTAPERVKGALQRFVQAKGVEANPDVLSDSLYRLADFEFSSGAIEEGSSHLLRALEVDAQEERALAMLEPIVRSGNATEMVVILFLRVSRKAATQETLLFAFRNAARAQTVERSVLDEAIVLARSLDDGEALRELLSRTIEMAETGEELESVRALIVERADLARSDEQFMQEAALLDKAIPLYEGSDRFELELRKAACALEHLGQIDEGRVALESLLEENPTDSRVWRPLLALYRNAGETDEVERLIALVEEHVTDEADLEALKMERVRLMVNADRLEEAEVELRKTLDERPHMAEAASILADLLRKAERWDELKNLVEDLYGRAREREDSALVARFGIELAQLVQQEDRQEAINIMAAGLRLAREDRKFLEYHLTLFSDEEDQAERADVMEHLLALERGERARDLTFELYTIREELGDEYGAGRALEVGVKAAPEQVELVETYEEYLRAREDAPRLAEVLILQAKQAGKTEAAALKYAEAADIYDQSLGDPEKAAEAISKAYECDSTNLHYLEKGAQYLVNLGRVDDALHNLSVAIEMGDETALADLLELRASIIRRERASIPAAMTQAAEDIKLALEQLIPEEQEDALQGARIEVLGDLRNLHQMAGDTDSERRVVLDLSDTLEGMGDSSGAIDTLASWVRDHESDRDVAKILGKKATEAGDHQAAMFAYQQLHQASDGSERVEAVLLLAEAAEAAGDAGAARGALEEAFAEDPGSEALRDRLRAMYEATGDYRELAAILMAEADKTEDPAMRSALLVDVGDLYVKADQGEDACEVYEQALELAESPYAITSKLAQAYVVLGQVERARTVLHDAVEAHGKRRSPELAVLQQGLARVAQAQGDLEGMFTWLESALMSDRNNGDVAKELAIRAQEEGRYEVAIKALQSLTLSKGAAPMSKAEAYFRQAQIAQAQGDAKKALLMARRASAADANLEGLDDLLAELGG